ncbi:hypothetical protein MBEHAL_1761 [Halarchaeum acidiphilum MH1-52-1]|uniref:Uncharacterized protein n=1 Tax=Halarchaeum acidiphilum MH1-52-1 TaxID=1261545 RepID=U2YFT7_9EURY|nr:PAS domain S-box protein [Halarchaeum acidiphilum]GAD53001.1 hypothetical protein MBEHAL_1761 [Halarchaeum acidiphilum MH1-52-1]
MDARPVPRLRELSWVPISLLGFLLLAIPFYDMWDDVSTLSWAVATTTVENAPLICLALALVYGGVWLGGTDWEPGYVWTVTKWNLGAAAGIAALYALVIALQLWAMHRLKPWILALDGVLFGAVAAFGVGVYSARRRMTETDLQRSREEYRTLTNDVLDTSEVATFVLDDDFHVVWISEATADYFGLDRSAVVGRDERTLITDRIAERFEHSERFRERLLETYAANDETVEFECHITAGPDREERWLKHWSQPIESGRYAGGRIEHYTDITATKRREQELDTRERTLREMYDVISDTGRDFEAKIEALIDIGRDLFDAEYGSFARIDTESDEYRIRIVRTEHAEREAGDVVPLVQTHCQRLVEEGRTVQFEARPFDVPPRNYGTDTGFETYIGTPVYVDDTLYGSLCFLDREEADSFDDWQLTMVELMGNWIGYEFERKRLLEERRKQLREEESKFEEVVEGVDNYAIFALDDEGHVTSWNQGAAQIKGYEQDEIVGEHFSVFYPEANVAEGLPESLLAEARETGRANHEGWRVRKDGTRFWADVTIASRRDADGDLLGYTKVVKDKTEQRERERALEHERERLEFMNRIIRHNILNGLNLVDARAGLLADEYVTDDAAREHLRTIRERVADLSSVIDTMRAFMDAIVRESDHETYPVALRDELDGKLTLARDAYPDADFETHDLPDPSTTVIADDLVGEVFENVLSNAVVHNDTANPAVDVWASRTTCEVQIDAESGAVLPNFDAENPDAEVETRDRPAIAVHVADNGPGIPDDEKEVVLEKGVSELNEPGNGFGLYLVKEMMYAYGGTVDVRDNDAYDDARGTVFDLVFPLADE